jgi:hypothetical protein
LVKAVSAGHVELDELELEELGLEELTLEELEVGELEFPTNKLVAVRPRLAGVAPGLL